MNSINNITDNSRQEKLEELLYKLRRARWLHRKACKFYQPRNNFMLALSFVVSGSISILSLTNTDSSSNTLTINQRQYIGYAITLIGFINGLITLLSNQLDYKTKINNNNLASKAYDRLITQVSFEINFPSDVPINEFVGLVEENILKLKNELEVMTEARFEKEINRMIDNGFDISSDAGYMPKKSFFDFFNRKNKQHTVSDTDSEFKTTNPIKKHQLKNKQDSDFIKQYKEKVIHETVLDNMYHKEHVHHPHFEETPSMTCHIDMNIDETLPPPPSPSQPIKSYSFWNYIRSFFPSKQNQENQENQEVKETELSDIKINHHKLSKISEKDSETETENEPSQISTQSYDTQNITSFKRQESSQTSPRALPLAVFNMRKI